ncbi:MAG: SIS domain-containing protein, partial [Candidatus Gastranaerophilaceae bacterium]
VFNNTVRFSGQQPNFAQKININHPKEDSFVRTLSPLPINVSPVKLFPFSKKVSFGQSSMEKEINEQPSVISGLVKKYLPPNMPVANIDLNMTNEEIKNISQIHIIASGSSRNVGNIAKYIMEKYADIPTEVEYASEFAHRKPSLHKNDLVIAISQSGTTEDTYSALKMATEKGVHTLALTNVPESKIHKLGQSKMEVGAGKENSIAATKSFTAQLVNLYALAVHLGEKKGVLSFEQSNKIKEELRQVKPNLERFLSNTPQIEQAANVIKDSKNTILLGRGINSSVVQEGALKIKETTYIDANGYPSGEFLHGHMAVTDKTTPVISIIVPDKDKENYNLSIANTEHIKQRRNPNLVIIKNEKDKTIEEQKAFKNAAFINIPQSSEDISPIYTVTALQLIALKTAEALGRDIDHPRDLTKSVMFEDKS